MAEPRALYAALFVTLGLVGAFMVSAIAGIGPGWLPGSERPPTEGEAHTLPVAAPIRVEILNGAGVAGLARRATEQVRGSGFDVVFFGNAARYDHTRSVVLDRAGDPAAARAVAAALGIDSIATAIDPTLFLHATVVLGADWPPPPSEPAGPLDRLRRRIVPPDTAP